MLTRPQRRLADADLADGLPAEKSIDALEDHAGHMLDLERGRTFDPEHQGGRLRVVLWPPRPLNLDRLAVLPMISAQRVTSSLEAKPCRAKPSFKVLRSKSASGRGKLDAGLVMPRCCSIVIP